MSIIGRGKVHNMIFFTNLFIWEHSTSGRGKNIFQYLELFNRYYGRWYIVMGGIAGLRINRLEGDSDRPIHIRNVYFHMNIDLNKFYKYMKTRPLYHVGFKR